MQNKYRLSNTDWKTRICAFMQPAAFTFSCVMVFGLPWSSAFFRIGFWGFLLCFLLSGRWREKWLTLSKDRLVLLGLVLFFLAVSSMTYTIAPFDLAQEDAMRYAKLVAIGPLLFTFDSPKKRTVVLLAFCSGCAVLMLPTLLDGSGLAKLLGMRMEGFINQAYTKETSGKGAPNLVYWRNQIVHGLFVAVLCFVCLQNAVSSSRHRIPLLVIAGLCVVDIVYFIQGRMAMLGLATVLVFFAMLQIKTARDKFAVATIAAMLLITSYFTVPNVTQRFDSATQEVQAYLTSGDISTSSGIRFHYWRISIDLFSHSKGLGAGAGAFRHILVSTQDPFASQKHSHTHNEYLTVLSEFGAGGLLVFLGLLINGFSEIRQMNARIESTERNCYAAVLILFSLGCFSDSMLYNPHEGWTLVIFLALIGAGSGAKKSLPTNTVSRSDRAESPAGTGNA
ncbi:MAG: O-antigen ligase family protein [Polaromonas sp.]|nr:O-antigen ligase family protein [Polaromonas sp.]